MFRNWYHSLALPMILIAIGVLCSVGLFRTLGEASPLPAAPTAPGGDQDKPKAAEARSETGGEREAIRKVAAAYIEALNQGDLKAILSHWSPDADYVDESGKVLRGREVIGAQYKESLAKSKGSKFKSRLYSLKFLRPDVALSDASVDVVSPDGTTSSNRSAVVWVKSNGQWLISSVRDLPTEVDSLPCLAYGQLKGMEWLVGEWVDQSDKIDVQISCRWFENKSFLVMEYKVSRPEEDPVLVRQRIGWDPLNAVVRSWVFDSKGGFGEGIWERDGNRWTIQQSATLPDGGVGSSRNSIEFIDQDTFIWRSKDRQVDGQPMADTEVKFARKIAQGAQEKRAP